MNKQVLVRETIAADVVRAVPIPNAPVNEVVPGVEKWDRNRLVEELNLYTARRNAEMRRGYFSGPRGPRESALWIEWDARINYWELQNLRKDVAAHNDDIEIREEIIEALMEEGKARHVAANLTNTTAKMLAEGKRLGIV